jgi:hypothetical protein
MGIAGGLFAAWKGIHELREANLQRQEDLRWRCAEMAKTCLDEIRNDAAAAAAMKMLDWENLRFKLPDGHDSRQISHTLRHQSLRTTDLTFDTDEQFVRDCYDAFFDGLQAIEHYINIKLIEFADVIEPLGYYVEILASPQEFSVMKRYLTEYKFAGALGLLGRFPVWQRASAES